RRVPDDLPEVSVGVAEVAGVDPPRAIVGSPRESRASSFGLGQQHIDLGAALDELSDAELARLRWPDGNVGIFGEFAARIEREHEAAFEPEYHDRARGVCLFVEELGGDDAGCFEAEAVAVEGERAVEIADGKCDHVDVRFHHPAPRSRGWSARLLCPFRIGRVSIATIMTRDRERGTLASV